ncbi:carboxylating nicotinate-nucleotide diphosphorylase [Candidatus Poribacteria bacterium]|nr:carboxylating nicotinate-nucleotide diphosphorylase [Candidatus Poribacteria bacterium]
MSILSDPNVRALFDLALQEDVGGGDITSSVTIPPDATADTIIVPRVEGVLAGIDVVAAVFHRVDDRVRIDAAMRDGDRLVAGEPIANVSGNARSILAAERTALNFLQRLCGIATATAQFVAAVEPYPVRVVDLRKTIPGWRALSKYAVRVGGGSNHRFGLFDGILIKDNHIAVCGSVREAIRSARAGAPHTMKVEIEVDTLEQLDEALEAGADIVLLDNMTPARTRAAVERAQGRALLEASGGIVLETVRDYAATGVDIISTSAITSAPPLDIGLDTVVRAPGSI